MEGPNLIGSGWQFPLRITGRGGIAMTGDEDEIAQAIELILSTPVGARLMRPEFGSRLHELVFAPINAATRSLARHYVEEALSYWEPRIDLLDITADPDPGDPACLLIVLRFRVKSSHDERALVFPFYSIPDED